MFCNIKRVRESYELTQREMAKILKISKSSYNNFETGEHIIPLKHLNNFCNTFHVSMDYVCGLTKNNIKVNNTFILDKKNIGKKLKNIRKDKNLTQEDIAKIINTSQSNISSYENGNTLILTAFLYNFAKHLNVSMDYICDRNNNIKIKTY